MKLSDLEMKRLLPGFMHQDPASVGMADGVDRVIRGLSGRLTLPRKWDQIDSMGHDLLDELAHELNVLWYSSAADLETKRRLIRNSEQVHASLGTPWAVEEVISSYLGDATLLEFWEYEGGRPHHFKVLSNNPQITQDMAEVFIWALEIVKRKSQWLDGIVTEQTSTVTSCAAMAIHEVSVDTVRMVRHASNLDFEDVRSHAGVAMHEISTETMLALRTSWEMETPHIQELTGMVTAETSIETHEMKGGDA